jgi:hypothetical protein
MNFIFNQTSKKYTNLTSVDDVSAELGTKFVLLVTDLDVTFNAAKRRTAMRGRYATDGSGQSMLEKLSLTDDERDWFDEVIKNGGAEVFRKFGAWTKGIDSAYRHNVKWGNPLHAGTVTTVSTTTLTDSTAVLPTTGLVGAKLVCVSPGANMNQERTITASTATSVTVDTAFSPALAVGSEYIIASVTGNFILQYLNVDYSWDLNLFVGLQSSMEEALTLFAVKEWYKINRNTNDFPIEEAEYNSQLSKIKSQLLRYKTPSRRVSDSFLQ